jgi:hypothetical protein
MGVAASVDDIRTEGVPYFDPEDYLINIVRRATANGQNIVISAGDLGSVTVLSARGEYFDRTKDLAAFCRIPSDELEVAVLGEGDGRLPASHQLGRNLDELMWHAAFHASRGRLMQGCYRDDVVELPNWPNLSRLPMTPNTIRLCALLTRHPTSVILAGRLLKVENAELYQFYSAARCAGLAHPVNRKAEEPKLEPYRDRGLLSRLVARIAGL